MVPVDTAKKPVIAVVAAAGKGTRLGASVPKAFVTLRGKSLVERSIRAMMTSAVVDEIIVLVSGDMQDYASDILARRGLSPEQAGIPIRLVRGGGERADSVWAGLKAIEHKEAVVLVHDAARALTPPGMIARVAKRVLDGALAVVPTLPVADTIKEVARDVVVSTPERASLRAIQTPQGFDLATLREANEAFWEMDNPVFQPTDDASLMEWHGVDVVCVHGDPMAFKITTPLDMRLAESIVNEVEPTIFEVI